MSGESAPVALVVSDELYDGSGAPPRREMAVVIEGGRIAELRPARAGDKRAAGAIGAEILAPGFIDMQINGASDVQFNEAPTVETLERIAVGARAGGAAYILPTFITAPGEDYAAAIGAAREAIERGMLGVLGLHLEGPFLSPKRPGIHPAAAIRTIAEADMERLSAPFPGPLLVTLAPEQQPPGTIERLVRAGRTVFAGHTEATFREIGRAKAEGLRGVTHLFNAMSQLTGREPGTVGAALASNVLHAGIIADGHHVAWPNVQLAARLMPNRLCLVTDAMCTLAGKRTGFAIGGRAVSLTDGRLVDASGRLAGAHVAMDECVANMVRHAGVPLEGAVRMATLNPATALGVADGLGVVMEGYRASLAMLDADMRAVGTVVDGRYFARGG